MTKQIMDLIDAYAEARHVQGHSSYNIKTQAARQAVERAIQAQAAINSGAQQAERAVPADAWQRAVEIRMAQGWALKGDRIPVLYTDSINGEQVCRDDIWLCITTALAPLQPAAPQAAPAELQSLFREALAWGMTYGPAIPAHQWDEMRESMAVQYVQRASMDLTRALVELRR